ncbi:ABC transporter permease [Allorhizobium taibaishanense]|uniref:ABC transporter permease n=1 Tax=Allorhizobium taibaishanense TaxID=887144 RepID=A0A1Q9A5F8_9HYPH|nr:ABC transporter permease [Allorhizobium taibaishanense]MBB4006906.1 sulfonate transport system permease protein [Allorhizobium taibaishanense]OLP49780.1 ABC transporter permease [Allorhizobium taibaishanense]
MTLLEARLARQHGEGSVEKQRRSRLSLLDRPVVGMLFPVSILVLWELLVTWGLVGGRLVPPPSRVLRVIYALAASGELLSHISVTLARVLSGFALGAVSGTLFGAATGYSARFARLLDPTLQALRAIPSIAWVPLFILWFGIFEASKVSLIAVGVFFPVYLGVSGALANVDRRIVEVGRIFRLSGFELIRRILLPAVLPDYAMALRAGLGLGWMFVVAAEFMGASEGLGYLLVDGQQLGKPDQIMAAILIFAVIGKATDTLLILLTAPFLRWQDSHGKDRGHA